jgi:ABC-type uncharacterized transport system involved in gliding motility auxiliary subunit
MPFQGAGRPIRSYAGVIAIAGLVLLVGSGILYFINRTWAIETQLGAGVGSVMLLGAVLLRPDAVQTALTGRSVKYGSHAIVMSLAFIGILAFVNIILFKHDREYDLTETGRFTLSDQTIKVLKNLDEPVQVMGFFQTGDPRTGLARDYLDRYGHYTKYLSYEFHDPNLEPALAQSFQIERYGLVFVSDDKQHQSFTIDEQALTSGLIRVINDQERMAYFITGHGEHQVDDGGKEGYSAVKETLEAENYRVASLNLSASGGVPADASLLILAGAKVPMAEIEAELIMDWMDSGGKLMLLVDPHDPAPLKQLVHQYGLALEDNYVVEDYDHSLMVLTHQGLTPQLIAPLITKYPYHEVTQGLSGYQSFYPLVRSITVTPTQTAGREVQPLLTTSYGSWAETDLQAGDFEFSEGIDPVGPFHLAVAVENFETGARLVVFGDAGFVANKNVSPQMANLDLFMNAVNWLAEEEALISIRPKPPENHTLVMTPMQVNMTFVTTIILIPLTVFGVGIGVWWKRR